MKDENDANNGDDVGENDVVPLDKTRFSRAQVAAYARAAEKGAGRALLVYELLNHAGLVG